MTATAKIAHPDMLRRLFIAAWWLCLFALASIYLVLGQLELPGLHWDASLYATPIISVAKGQGWRFDSHEPLLLVRPDRIFDSHGVISTLFYGQFLKASTYQRLFTWISVVNAATFIAYTFLYRRALSRLGWLAWPVSLLLGTIAGVLMIGLQGRPEHLIPAMLTIPFLIYFLRAPSRICIRASAILLGTVFMTSPLPGLMATTGFISCLALLRGRESMAFWKDVITTVVLASVTTIAIVHLFTPFSFLHWFKAVHSIGASGDLPDFTHWFLSPFAKEDLIYGKTMFAPLWNWFVLLIFFYIVTLLINKKCFASTALMIGSAVFFTPRACDYTYACLFPTIILALLVSHIAQPMLLGPSRLGSQQQVGPILLAFPLLLGLLYFSGFARIVHGAAAYYPYQPAYVRQGLCSALANEPSHLSQSMRLKIVGFPPIYTPSLIALSGDEGCRFITKSASLTPNRVQPSEQSRHVKWKSKPVLPDYYILPKSAFDFQDKPPQQVFVEGRRFSLKRNFWHSRNRKVLGTMFPEKLSQGYDVAIYQRDDP